MERLGEGYGLIVIGDGSLREKFERELEKRGLEERVFYFSRIPNVQMYRYYAASDYFVNFNTHEIFGMSILEAMYQGCIVVARRAPGPEQIIENGVSGFLCSSDQEMDEMLAVPQPSDIGERARNRVMENFTWDATAERIRAEVFRKICENT